MNQILLTEDINNDKKSSKKSYNEEPKMQKQRVKNVSTNSNDIKKIILFFAVVIIIFGVALGGIYGYRVYKNKHQDVITDDENNPQIEINEDASNPDKLVLIASSKLGLDKIIYIFDGEEQEEELNGRTSLETTVNIPAGTEELEIQVYDINGNMTETYKTFEVSTAEKPKIETSIVENGKLKIIATSSENAMKYITYEWNGEEKITVNAQDNEDTIETIIDVKRGKNEITIIAVDTANNKETITKTFNGVNNPIIDVVKDGDKLHIKVNHDMGIKKIEYDFNGKLYKYDENYSKYDPSKTEVEFFFTLKEGENTIIVTATSSEDTEEVYTGRCEYTPEEENTNE